MRPQFEAIRQQFTTPEEINDSPDTAPSKRMESIVPGYEKPLLAEMGRQRGVPVGMERITIEPGKRGGKPCVRGLRITVWDIRGWPGARMTEARILNERPDLEKDDFPAVYQFASETCRRTKIG